MIDLHKKEKIKELRGQIKEKLELFNKELKNLGLQSQIKLEVTIKK
jgi:hypothetical protein